MLNNAFNLSNLDGHNGFAISGATENELAGHSVSSAGDLNGDNIDDFIIGAYEASSGSHSYAGKTYLVFGRNNSWVDETSFASLDGSNGCAILGINANDGSGFSVSGAGDVNGDGIDDIAIGARFAEPNGLYGGGECYVLFGYRGIWPPEFNLSTINGTNGFRVQSTVSNGQMGAAVAGIGDINHDGFDDVAFGAPAAAKVYVVFGRLGSWAPSFLVSTLNGENGFTFVGRAVDDFTGRYLSSAGDINNDRVSDFLVTSPNADSGEKLNAGEVYVIFGHEGPWFSEFNLTSLNGVNGFILEGGLSGDHLSTSTSFAGDINGDTIDDILVGAVFPGVTTPDLTGKTYIIYGHESPWSSRYIISYLNGINGSIFSGIVANDRAGQSVSSGADLNGDSMIDFVIGAYYAAPNDQDRAGESYVIFGKNITFPLEASLSSLNGSNGVVLQGGSALENSGVSLSIAGDVNADGDQDLIIGGYQNNVNGLNHAGKVYVIFGGAERFSANTLSIKQGETLLLNASNIQVTPNISSRKINVTNVEHGYFAFISNSSRPITSFFQGQINNNEIIFVHDNSDQAPSYLASASRVTRLFSDVYPESGHIIFESSISVTQNTLSTDFSELPAVNSSNFSTLYPSSIAFFNQSSTIASQTTENIQGTSALLVTLSTTLGVLQETDSNDGGGKESLLIYLLSAFVSLIMLTAAILSILKFFRNPKVQHVNKIYQEGSKPTFIQQNRIFNSPSSSPSNTVLNNKNNDQHCAEPDLEQNNEVYYDEPKLVDEEYLEFPGFGNS